MLDRDTYEPFASVADHNKRALAAPGHYTTGKSTSGSTTYTTGLESPFTAQDVGRRIAGTNIPAGTTIAAYTGVKSVELSQAATGTSTSGTLAFTIERPERFNQNCFLGKVDPETGIYYFITNDDQGAVQSFVTSRFCLMALLPGATESVLVDVLPQNGLGLHINNTRRRVYAGQISRPLL